MVKCAFRLHQHLHVMFGDCERWLYPACPYSAAILPQPFEVVAEMEHRVGQQSKDWWSCNSNCTGARSWWLLFSLTLCALLNTGNLTLYYCSVLKYGLITIIVPCFNKSWKPNSFFKKFLLDIFFIYISNAIPFPGFPSENPLSHPLFYLFCLPSTIVFEIWKGW